MIKEMYKKINMRPKNLNNFLIGLCLFLLFLFLLVLEIKNVFAQFDPQITYFLQTIIPRSADLFLSLFTLTGGVEITSLLLLLIAYFLYHQGKSFPFFLALFVVIVLFEGIGKFLLYHPGPPKNLFRYSLPFAIPEYVSTRYSFPSGHVGRTTFLVVIGLFLAEKFLKNKTTRKLTFILLLIFLSLMAVSRVYLGEHWASDVLGGLLLGSSMGFFAMVYY